MLANRPDNESAPIAVVARIEEDIHIGRVSLKFKDLRPSFSPTFNIGRDMDLHVDGQKIDFGVYLNQVRFVVNKNEPVMLYIEGVPGTVGMSPKERLAALAASKSGD